MSRAIQHNVAQSRFEWTEDGMLSVQDYDLQNGVMTITHTGVPEAVGGRGIAGDLTRAALETATEQALKVRPMCSYVATYIERHPEYKALVL
ncbi:GNAT family N-acetyltransferase [Pusillimonas sp. ANT_WB101]|uniref:GNAT family N-acetyltransferase n=1 Tax=Pusillimonas sp. ANT_WB101 TaxID=2597356 RepID=UPI0011EEEA96|nr:GNAT family N-acetyltransferase [Pusillimonas sp. ANT_WB101]KAA0888557.1 N-acetyltransferase [Pusillimonas sp. ANT_WB101]